MEHTNLAWLAGIIDGEGTMGVYTLMLKPKREGLKAVKTYTINFGISNIDPRIINHVKHLCYEILNREPLTSIQVPKTVGRGNTPKYEVRFSSQRDILTILKAVEPYLIGKLDQAQILIELIERRELGSRWTEKDKAVIPILKQLKRPWVVKAS